MKWDIFISHANEDKESFVEPLAQKLKHVGYKVWYDKFSLKVGDGIRKSIEKGLTNSEYGLVILSPNFFTKEWPQRELDSLFALEIGEKSKVLPVWLNVNYGDVKRYSPLLADRFALNASEGIDNIIAKLQESLKIERFLNKDEFEEKIMIFKSNDKNANKYIAQRAIFNLHKLTCYHNEHFNIDVPDDLWENQEKVDQFFEQTKQSLKHKYEIPPNVYLDYDGPLESAAITYITSLIKKWVNGKLEPDDSYELYFLLEEIYDLDCMLILFDIPNYTISGERRDKLVTMIIEFGSRYINKSFNQEIAYKKVFEKYYT